MTITLIIVVLLLAIQTVRVWINRRLVKQAMKLNTDLLELTDEQRKVIEGARVVNRLLAKERECEEWPEILG